MCFGISDGDHTHPALGMYRLNLMAVHVTGISSQSETSESESRHGIPIDQMRSDQASTDTATRLRDIHLI